MNKTDRNSAYIDSQNLNLSTVKFLYERKKLLKVISPYQKTCSSLLKATAKEKLVFVTNLKGKLAYKKKNTA